MHPRFSAKKSQGGEKKRKKTKTARGRVQRDTSRVSRLQAHSLSQALLASSKLGMGVFSTLSSASRCFLLSDFSEGREAGIAQHTPSPSILLFLPLYTQTPEDGPGIPLLIFRARCSVAGHCAIVIQSSPTSDPDFTSACTHARKCTHKTANKLTQNKQLKKNPGLLETKPVGGGTIIGICNWEMIPVVLTWDCFCSLSNIHAHTRTQKQFLLIGEVGSCERPQIHM